MKSGKQYYGLVTSMEKKKNADILVVSQAESKKQDLPFKPWEAVVVVVFYKFPRSNAEGVKFLLGFLVNNRSH